MMRSRLSRRDCLLSLAAIALSPITAHAADDELTRLFAELGAKRERQAKFVERKFSALLKAPVESSGTLSFRAPDLLERRTETPQRETVRIEGNTVSYESAAMRGGGKRTFSLSDAPPLAALIESLRATLAGDLPTLRRLYEVTWSAQKSGWQLTLVPRDRGVRDAVEKVILRGVGGDVSAVEIVETGGDLTLLQITSLAAIPKK